MLGLIEESQENTKIMSPHEAHGRIWLLYAKAVLMKHKHWNNA